jgi:hypothetical protein
MNSWPDAPCAPISADVGFSRRNVEGKRFEVLRRGDRTVASRPVAAWRIIRYAAAIGEVGRDIVGR